MAGQDPRRAERELARLIRRSPVLDAALKRHWLRVLPHLSPRDRRRLEAVLREAESSTVEREAP
jgi:hypothetical protein